MVGTSSSKIYLLDVNVLLAIVLPQHIAHSIVYPWFMEMGRRGFSTCAMTQSGFVRLLSNPATYVEKVTHEDAIQSLQRLTSFKNHFFWPMDVDYSKATAPLHSRIFGHKQTTDAYLLGLAIHHRGKLATLDKAICHLAGSEFASHVEYIQ
ncbi:TA system VapC family ribonuclease toxin [Acidicapsa ligni]|uniref:TA system VapC family ribonuclease toxin n=1 Tax=Acidicapsa ligni TaxID=542300 RepID=UPI0021E0BD92|nr:TA system VapC family ribonuclease toxin [Acidicapsa ligni]